MSEEFILKFLGSVTVIISSTCIGIKASDKLNYQLELLRQMKQLVILICGEIKYNNSYLGQAFLNISNRISEPYKSLMLEVSEILYHETGEAFSDIWKRSVDETLSKTELSKKHILKLQELGNTLGFLDKEMQISNFELFIERLDYEIEEGVQKNKENCKLYRSLGVLSGIAIVILTI